MENKDETNSIINQPIPAYKEITKKKYNKKFFIYVFILGLFFIFNIFMIIFYNYHDNKLPPPNGYLKENTNNHTLGNCYIYDECRIENINGTEKLIAHKKYKLPTQYKTDINGSNCPLYWEAAPTYIKINDDCNDLGYGCCKLPIDHSCAIRIHFEYEIGIYRTVFLYRKNMDSEQNINIAKEDINGTNCPTYERLLYEALLDYNVLIKNILFFSILIQIILVLCISYDCINNKCFKYEKILVSSESV